MPIYTSIKKFWSAPPGRHRLVRSLLWIVIAFGMASTATARETTVVKRYPIATARPVEDPAMERLRVVADSVGRTGNLEKIAVEGYSSPDGPYRLNSYLALERAKLIRKYLINRLGVDPAILSVTSKAEDWEGLRRAVEDDTQVPDRDAVMKILNSGASDAVMESRLRALDGGKPWRYLARNILGTLRRTVIRFFTPETVSEVIIISEEVDPEAADSASNNDDASASEVTVIEEETTDILTPSSDLTTPITDRISPTPDRNSCWALKTNALYLAAGVTNLGAEYAFNEHWSLDLPVVYSPYTLGRTYRMRFLYAQPEARYWVDGPLKGHFFGVHLHAGVFNVSLNETTRYQSEKGFYGAGISYGYSLPFATHWSAEFTIGLGYAHTKYCTYQNTTIPNGRKILDDVPYNYWGLTKAAVNIVYRFGQKNAGRKEVNL